MSSGDAQFLIRDTPYSQILLCSGVYRISSAGPQISAAL